MIRSICRLPHKIVGQMAVDILSRSMASQAPQSMESYFKDKRFIVTGSCAGKCQEQTSSKLNKYSVS